MKKIKNIFLGIIFIGTNISFAQFKGYKYAQKINPVAQNNYYSVLLNATTLSRSQSNFVDYRVYQDNDGDTTEVPYILKWQDDLVESFTSEGNIIDRNYTKGGTQYLTIEFPGQARVNELQLDVSESNFDKEIKIECSNDNKNWKIIEENLRIVGINWFGAYYRSTSVDFSESSYRYFRLTVSNVAWSPYERHKDNIDITSVRSTFNKCLSASFKKMENISVKRRDYRYDPSEKNDTIIYRAFNKQPPNPKAIRNRMTDFRNPLNPTELRIELPSAAYIHHIKLTTKDTGDFYRMCDINVFDNYKSFSNDEGYYLMSGQIFSSVTNNVYSIGNSFGRYIIIKIFNLNDKAKEDFNIEVFTQDARLICKLEKQKDYFIAYGKVNDYAPQYDNIYFQQKLPGAYTDVNLGAEVIAPEKQIQKTEAIVKNKMWLWVVMGTLMLFIGYFALKLMKKQNDN